MNKKRLVLVFLLLSMLTLNITAILYQELHVTKDTTIESENSVLEIELATSLQAIDQLAAQENTLGQTVSQLKDELVSSDITELYDELEQTKTELNSIREENDQLTKDITLLEAKVQ